MFSNKVILKIEKKLIKRNFTKINIFKNLTIYFKVINIIGILLIIQILLGVLTLLSGAQMLLASMHQINSIFLVSSSVYFLYLNNNSS